MLRARGDRWEYLAIEVALRRAAPPPLTPEQRERIRARIMAQLGAQEPARPPLVFRTRWVAVPVGAGLAATIVAGVRLVAHRFSGDEGGAGVVVGGRLLTGGRTVDELGTGQVAVARTDTTVLFPEAGARFDAVAGSRFELLADSGELVFRLETGRFSVASEATPVRLQGQGWSAVFATGGVGSANVASDRARFTVYEGALTVSVGGAICTAGAGDTVIVEGNTCLVIPGNPGGNPAAPGQGGANPGEGGNPGGNPAAPGQGGANPGQGGNAGGNPAAPGQGGANPGQGGSAGGNPAAPGQGGANPGQGSAGRGR